MARHIHVHLHRTNDSEPEGHWVTINGARVFIGKGGKGDEHMTTAEHRNAGREAGNKLDWKTAEHHYAEAIRKYPQGQRAGALGQKDLAMLEERRKGAEHQAKLAGSDEPGKKMTKADAKKAAKAEREKAGRGEGSYQKAAELYEQAGEKDKAAEARALARRYGHDPEGQARKGKADADAAATARAQARKARSSAARKMLLEKAELHEKRAKDPENNAHSQRLSELNDALLGEETKMGNGDLDDMRDALRKEHPGKTPEELNEIIEQRLR